MFAPLITTKSLPPAKLSRKNRRSSSLTPNCLTDVLDDVARVGEATGQRHIAERVVEELEQRISSVREQAATSSARPRVACLEWFDPIYLAGHWVPEMIEIAGAEDVLGRRGEPSEKVEWQSIRESTPEIIVLMPCGFRCAANIARSRGARTTRRLARPAGSQSRQSIRRQRARLL